MGNLWTVVFGLWAFMCVPYACGMSGGLWRWVAMRTGEAPRVLKDMVAVESFTVAYRHSYYSRNYTCIIIVRAERRTASIGVPILISAG